MLKCAILKEIFYQDSVGEMEKIAYEKIKEEKERRKNESIRMEYRNVSNNSK